MPFVATGEGIDPKVSGMVSHTPYKKDEVAGILCELVLERFSRQQINQVNVMKGVSHGGLKG